MKHESVEEVLDFAIQNEQSAVEFYTNLADQMQRQNMKSCCVKLMREIMKQRHG